MNHSLQLGLTSLIFAAVAASQNIIQPPPDCATEARASAKAAAATSGCAGTLTGAGTAGTIPVFTSTNSVGNSVMVQSAAGGIGIGGQPASATKLEVAGNAHVTGNVIATGLINAPGIFLQSGTVTASGNITAQGDLIASGNVTAPQ